MRRISQNANLMWKRFVKYHESPQSEKNQPECRSNVEKICKDLAQQRTSGCIHVWGGGVG